MAGLVVAAGGVYFVTTADQVTQAPAQSQTDALAVAEQMPAGLEPARVTRVVDGDTIRVVRQGAVEETVVRLVGIDTPETVDPNRPVECYGPEASAYLTELLTSRDVYLEADAAQGDTDRYGRLLRYVWLAQDGSTTDAVLINASLLRAGYAIAYQGNHTRKDAFDTEAATAEQAGTGLWSACPA